MTLKGRIVEAAGRFIVCIAIVVLCDVAAAAPQQCAITISADGVAALGGLELQIDYGAANGEFLGADGDVACVGLATGAYASARDDDSGRKLVLGMISPAGVPLPREFWRCTFQSNDGVPLTNQFVVVVEDAIDASFQPVATTGSISSIACGSLPVCGNGIIEGSEECDDAGASLTCDGKCELTANTQRCAIGFRVTGSAPIGGIQFRVDYQESNGKFEGSGVAAACTGAPDGALTAVDDRDGDMELRLALVSGAPLLLPIDLWRCSFVTNAALLQIESFAIHSVIATDASLAGVPVSVSAISNSCIYGPYCGDGNVDPGEACDDGNSIDTDACTDACTVARCGDGVARAGVEQCDDGNSVAGDCCSSVCTFEAATTVCRVAAGVCDHTENCTGTSGTCPTDAKKTTVCRASAGVCDTAELCNGSSNACGSDAGLTSLCRASAGICDIAEFCTGTHAACPANGFASSATSCTSDGNPCTNDQCNGSGTCAHPGNSQPCDDGLFCNGSDTCSGGSCGLHAGSPCSGPDGDSNCRESCTESTDTCNADDPDGSACNDGNGSAAGDQCLNGSCLGGSGAVCGDADGDGSVKSTDALRVLRAAVGQSVNCPLSRCDVDNNGKVQTGDALKVLKKAVGQSVVMTCP